MEPDGLSLRLCRDIGNYLHPGDTFEMPHVLRDVAILDKPVPQWTAETSAHARRLFVIGVFDRVPRAQIILGHAGETLPYVLWRLDSRYALTSTNCRIKNMDRLFYEADWPKLPERLGSNQRRCAVKRHMV